METILFWAPALATLLTFAVLLAFVYWRHRIWRKRADELDCLAKLFAVRRRFAESEEAFRERIKAIYTAIPGSSTLLKEAVIEILSECGFFVSPDAVRVVPHRERGVIEVFIADNIPEPMLRGVEKELLECGAAPLYARVKLVADL